MLQCPESLLATFRRNVTSATPANDISILLCLIAANNKQIEKGNL